MPVGKEAVGTHTVWIVPNDEVYHVKKLFAPDLGYNRQQITASRLTLILKTAEDYEISAFCENAPSFEEPFSRPR